MGSWQRDCNKTNKKCERILYALLLFVYMTNIKLLYDTLCTGTQIRQTFDTRGSLNSHPKMYEMFQKHVWAYEPGASAYWLADYQFV